MIRRTSAENAKNGITCSHFLRQAAAIAGYFLAPFGGIELLEPLRGLLGIVGLIDRLQRAGDVLALLPGGKCHRVADQVHDTGLDLGCRIDALDRLRKALQAVDHGDQDVLGAAGLELGHHPEPELRAVSTSDPLI